MRERGLTVESALGDVRPSRGAQVTDDPAIARAGRHRACSASSCGTSRARRAQIRPLLASGGVVDSVPERHRAHRADLARVARRDRVLGGIAYIAATIARAGRHRAHRDDGAPALRRRSTARAAARGRSVRASVPGAGIDAELSADIRRALWEKFVLPVGAVGRDGVARQPIGVMRADPDLRATFEAAMRETWTRRPRARRRARRRLRRAAAGVRSTRLPAEMTRVDAERPRRGQPARGAVAVAARSRAWAASGLAAPVNATLYAALKPYVAGARAERRSRNTENPSCACCSSGSSTRWRCSRCRMSSRRSRSTRSSTALIAALVLGLINTLIRPLLILLTLPVTLLTLGLFIFVINGLLFWCGRLVRRRLPGRAASGRASSARSSTA